MSEAKKTETTSDATAPSSDGSMARKSRKHKKAWITVGVVVVILAVGGVGFSLWHAQPSFCNAICHTPMDPYLPTYESPVNEKGIDKWGNEVSNSNAMMAALHREQNEDSCLSCHVPTLGEQVSEGANWITGNYEVLETQSGMQVLAERSLDELVEARGIAPDEFCLNSSCHNMTREDLIKATSDMKRNPHVAQHGKNSCSDCHKAHRASVNKCSECHADAELPEGWITAAESNKLIKELESM